MPLLSFDLLRRVAGPLLGVLLGLGAFQPAAAQDGFTDMMLRDLPVLQYGAGAWGDYDGDGDFDAFLTGNLATFDTPVPLAQLYINRGDTVILLPNQVDPVNGPPRRFPTSQFRPAVASGAPVVQNAWLGDVAWADFDGDGDLDAAVTGRDDEGRTRLFVYENSGTADRFRLRASFGGVRHGALAWADVDNDGDADLALAGEDAAGQPTTTLYENTAGTFNARPTSLPGLRYADLAFADVDADGDADLAASGQLADGRFAVRLYRNDGGTFSEVAAGLEGRLFARLAWGDYDADGDPDLLVSGARLHPFVLQGVVDIYENQGGTLVAGTATLIGSFENDDTRGRYQGDARWGDYNGDGLLDFLIAGLKDPLGFESGQLYRGDGTGRFTKDVRFGGALFGSADFGDYDGDHDLDLLVVGQQPGLGTITRVLRNELGGNAPPQPPAGLRAAVAGDAVTLTWDAATDDRTPAGGLTYNLRVGTMPGAADVVSPMALASGRRLLSGRGNAGSGRSGRLRGLAPGTYFWSVQALDAAYAGSAFAPEATFTIP